MGLTQAEARVARLLDKGMKPSSIAGATGIAPCIVERVTNWSSVAGDAARDAETRKGSDLLLAAIERERSRGVLGATLA